MSKTSYVGKYKRTGLFVIDQELLNWAEYRSKQLGHESVSDYIFDLIRKDKKQAKDA